MTGLWKLDGARPCPFCGSSEIEWCLSDDDGALTENFHEMDGIDAYCPCGGHISLDNIDGILTPMQAEAAILEKWNRRAVSDTAKEIIERIARGYEVK